MDARHPLKQTVIESLNLSESFPDACSPLTEDLINRVYPEVYRSFLKKIGFMSHPPSVRFFKGRVFYEFEPESLTHSIVTRMKNAGVSLGLSPRSWPAVASFFPGKSENQVRQELDHFKKKLNDAVSNHDPESILKTILEAMDAQPDWWAPSLLNDLKTAFWIAWVKKSLLWFEHSDSTSAERIFQSLWCGIPITPTHEIERNLSRIRHSINKDLEFLNYLKSCLGTHHLSLEMMRMRNEDLTQMIEDFIDHFGSRVPGEMKLETRTLKELPEQILPTLIHPKPHLRNLDQLHPYVFPYQGWKSIILKFLMKRAISGLRTRERMRWMRSEFAGNLRRSFLKIGDSLQQSGWLETADDVFFLRLSELAAPHSDFRQRILDRRAQYHEQTELKVAHRYETKDGQPIFSPPPRPEFPLKGKGCSGGQVRGTAVVVHSIHEWAEKSPDLNDKILVIRSLDPGWSHVLLSARGLITEQGSILSHVAILCREYGIPAVFGVEGALEAIQSGQIIELNSINGSVERAT